MGKFSKDEEVIVRDGPMKFRGKIIQCHSQANEKNNEIEYSEFYLIHYPGWGKKYDIWCQEHDVFKITTEQLESMEYQSYHQNIDKLRKAYAIYKRKSPRLALVDEWIKFENAHESKKSGRKLIRTIRKKRKHRRTNRASPGERLINIKLEPISSSDVETSMINDDKEQKLFHGFFEDGTALEGNFIQRDTRQEQVKPDVGSSISQHPILKQCNDSKEESENSNQNSNVTVPSVPASPTISSINQRENGCQIDNDSSPKQEDIHLKEPKALSFDEICQMYTKEYEELPFEIEEIEIDIDFE